MRDERDYQPEVESVDLALPQKPRFSLARQLARKALRDANIKAPPVDLEAVLRARKLVLKRVEVDGFLSGVLHAEDREVVVNVRGRSIQRQRFTIAHEIGHFDL